MQESCTWHHRGRVSTDLTFLKGSGLVRTFMAHADNVGLNVMYVLSNEWIGSLGPEGWNDILLTFYSAVGLHRGKGWPANMF